MNNNKKLIIQKILIKVCNNRETSIKIKLNYLKKYILKCEN